MVKHIVCFKLENNSPEQCKMAQDVILSMRGKVPTAKDIQAHIDALHSERSFDVMLEVLVDSWASLDEYQNDPYHCNIVKKHLGSVSEKSISFDYEV